MTRPPAVDSGEPARHRADPVRHARSDPPPDSPEALARQVLDAEARAIAGVPIDPSFPAAVEMLAAVPGHVVVSGLGKSGLVGAKLSATLASTGTPSHFLHPTEAMHGDLGRIRRDDAVILLSYSGQTDEVIALASLLRPDRVPTVAIAATCDSDLARLCDVTLCVGDIAEACPHNLAPTATTTAMMALGDALALALMTRRGFGVDDFKRVHPGGGLGRQLLPVTQAMRFRVGDNLAAVTERVPLDRAFATTAPTDPTLRRAGAMLVVDDAGRLSGIFTDGDLRRHVIDDPACMGKSIGDLMTRDPRVLPDTALVRDAVRVMRERRIDEVPVVDAAGKPVGMIDVQDLVALKVIEQ